ncbi:MAG TPA: S-layer homology domain-containing protein [Candidatus Scatomorpha pullistercoris]|uniref:S-layer homology domain-containing protein n=1 Tax=Candidatus Scatomorpha pullistercoris TaxID=2840929 RepID=A0A9D1K843_9FIRM|nr:S-layer homology domain-containing protein [Candidatus Scatomorpha pullistercoris]
MYTRKGIALCAMLLTAAVMLTAFAPMLPAHADGNAPVAQNLEITTYRNVSVGGRLTAVDPDGDTLTYSVTTEPTKGEIELTDDGRFVYTPDTNRKGRDYFGYKATDSEGNSSQEATVIIRIEKQKTNTTYSDLTGDASQYAATMLAEEGIFVGSQLGGSYVFEPDRDVTRGEFLAMCMELGGDELLTAVAATGFSDDDDIPVWQKRYVATALMDGVISGTEADGDTVFSSGDSITVQEAAVMLNNVLGTTDVPTAAFDGLVPAWASQATANLTACGVLTFSSRYTDTLTRADAAEMLCAAIEVRDSRE